MDSGVEARARRALAAEAEARKVAESAVGLERLVEGLRHKVEDVKQRCNAAERRAEAATGAAAALAKKASAAEAARDELAEMLRHAHHLLQDAGEALSFEQPEPGPDAKALEERCRAAEAEVERLRAARPSPGAAERRLGAALAEAADRRQKLEQELLVERESRVAAEQDAAEGWKVAERSRELERELDATVERVQEAERSRTEAEIRAGAALAAQARDAEALAALRAEVTAARDGAYQAREREERLFGWLVVYVAAAQGSAGRAARRANRAQARAAQLAAEKLVAENVAEARLQELVAAERKLASAERQQEVRRGNKLVRQRTPKAASKAGTPLPPKTPKTPDHPDGSPADHSERSASGSKDRLLAHGLYKTGLGLALPFA